MSRCFEKICYVLIAATVLLLFSSRCANTTMGPSGGPKDTIPPVLLRVSPEQNAVNFKAKKIVLTFNENMALKDVSKNVLLSPPTLQRPVIRRSGHAIQVLLKDTLQSNRTYTLDFGSALVDNNESNPFPPYTYVFSTGPVIDSMAFYGVVRDAYTLNPVAGAMVMLYENLSDTAIYKTLPTAVALTDSWGFFTVQNIAPRTYRMIAVDDKNSNYRYDPGSESIAFLDSLITPETTIRTLPPQVNIQDTAALLARPYERVLFASTENVRKQYLRDYLQLGKRQLQLIFNQYHPSISSFTLEGIDSTGYIIEHSRFNDTLTYWLTTPTLPDTLHGVINYLKTDSLEQLSPTEASLKFFLKKEEVKDEKKKDKDDPEKIPTLQPTINFDQQTGMHNGFVVSFNAFPTHIDTTKIKLYKLNAEKKTRTGEPFRWVRDTVSLRRFYVQAKWTTLTDYELEILPDAFADVYGLKNDTIVSKTTTPNPDKYSHITLSLSKVLSQYIVQLLDTKKEKVLREIRTDKDEKIVFDYLRAGDYCIRFIADENRNGVWDPGVVATHKQPERVKFLRLSSSTDIIQLKENFDITQDVDIEKLFAPEEPRKYTPEHYHEHDDHDHEIE